MAQRVQVRELSNDDGFDYLDARYAGGRPPKFTLPQPQRIKRIALARPTDHDLPFSTWSLSKLAEFVVAEGVVDDIRRRSRQPALTTTAVPAGHPGDLPGCPERASGGSIHRTRCHRDRP